MLKVESFTSQFSTIHSVFQPLIKCKDYSKFVLLIILVYRRTMYFCFLYNVTCYILRLQFEKLPLTASYRNYSNCDWGILFGAIHIH